MVSTRISMLTSRKCNASDSREPVILWGLLGKHGRVVAQAVRCGKPTTAMTYDDVQREKESCVGRRLGELFDRIGKQFDLRLTRDLLWGFRF
jgi:hypothetical protein